MILSLANARLVNFVFLRSWERVDHVNLLLLDAADPLTVLDYRVMFWGHDLELKLNFFSKIILINKLINY